MHVTDRSKTVVMLIDWDNLQICHSRDAPGTELDLQALIALAQVEPDADYSEFDTVLNLFEPDVTVPGLTEWDLIYLRALYSGWPEHLTVGEQARRMVPALRDAHSRE